jgi:hypothetical protein
MVYKVKPSSPQETGLFILEVEGYRAELALDTAGLMLT